MAEKTISHTTVAGADIKEIVDGKKYKKVKYTFDKGAKEPSRTSIMEERAATLDERIKAGDPTAKKEKEEQLKSEQEEQDSPSTKKPSVRSQVSGMAAEASGAVKSLINMKGVNFRTLYQNPEVIKYGSLALAVVSIIILIMATVSGVGSVLASIGGATSSCGSSSNVKSSLQNNSGFNELPADQQKTINDQIDKANTGSTATPNPSTCGAQMSAEVLGRLQQRALFLEKNSTPGYTVTTDPKLAAYFDKLNVTNANTWEAACPDIVNIIYGLSPSYVGNDGVVNAYLNYSRHSELYASATFLEGTYDTGKNAVTINTGVGGVAVFKSAGTYIGDDIPAGAIVSRTSDSDPGHTFVILFVEADGTYDVVDNSGGYVPGGDGTQYRKIAPTSPERNNIVGWALPKDTGFEGTFLNDAEGLPAVPAQWVSSSAPAAPKP